MASLARYREHTAWIVLYLAQVIVRPTPAEIFDKVDQHPFADSRAFLYQCASIPRRFVWTSALVQLTRLRQPSSILSPRCRYPPSTMCGPAKALAYGSTASIEAVSPCVVVKKAYQLKTECLRRVVAENFAREREIFERLGHHPRIIR